MEPLDLHNQAEAKHEQAMLCMAIAQLYSTTAEQFKTDLDAHKSRATKPDEDLALRNRQIKALDMFLIGLETSGLVWIELALENVTDYNLFLAEHPDLTRHFEPIGVD